MRATVEPDGHWEVDRGFVLPQLGDLLTDARIDHDTVDLVTAYFDTPDRDLHAFGMTLIRHGGEGSTWQLRFPAGQSVHFAASAGIPDDLATALRGVTQHRDLDHVATIRTTRNRYVVTDGDGTSCIEIDDDELRASLGDRLLSWREVRAAPVPGRLRKRLRKAGARPSDAPARLAALLSGDRRRGRPPPAPGAAALSRYVVAQIDEITAGDVALRSGHDPIHDTRVAIRRLRSTIRVFGRLFDHARTDVAAVESDLKWFAGVLGEVRDCQVQQRRFQSALAGLPDELVLGPVHARVRNDLRAVELPARTAVTEAMDSSRYLSLLAALRSWRVEPPIPSTTRGAAVLEQARKAQRKARRRLEAAVTADEADLLHRARKAAKRARYAAELTMPLDPKAARRSRKRFKKIQRVLGDHQDTVVAVAWLRRLGAAAGTTQGENGFTFGLLYGREESLAAESRRAACKLS